MLGRRRFTIDVERVLFALVANRAVEPCSKLAAAEWACCDVAISGLQAMDEDQAYQAMDLLIEADAQACHARGAHRTGDVRPSCSPLSASPAAPGPGPGR